MKTVLTIAGSDPSAGAGLQADLKTIHACGGYGLSVVTAITAQSTLGVDAVYPLPPEQVRHQLQMLIKDIRPDAIKIGMLGSAEIVQEVATFLQQLPEVPVVCDTVLLSSSGAVLLPEAALNAFKQHLLPLCDWFTPNLPEAQHLLGKKGFSENALQVSLQAWVTEMGNGAILKGGHGADQKVCCDTLITAETCTSLCSPKIQTPNLHGTGCTFASAFATYLAQGFAPITAFEQTKAYLSCAIEAGQTLKVGQGNGPLQHFCQKS
ncbi:bifunctional hydroxymethylpyrimidine kinase/phosphomethylpyrimidine kinase [Galenea microaerophila]